jgi:hypothetical protein
VHICRVLSKEGARIEDQQSGCNRCLAFFRPFAFVFGVLLFLFSLFLFISVLMTQIVKVMFDVCCCCCCCVCVVLFYRHSNRRCKDTCEPGNRPKCVYLRSCLWLYHQHAVAQQSVGLRLAARCSCSGNSFCHCSCAFFCFFDTMMVMMIDW